MKILAIANQKGGVGKTTTVVHVAHYAQREGLRVLLLDYDGQRNASSCFTSEEIDPAKYLTSTTLLRGNPDGLQPFEVDGFGIIAGDKESNDAEAFELEVISRPAKILPSFADRYDLCVIDCPPGLGRRLLASLIAADYVLTPFELERFALDGIGDLMDTIKTVRRTGMNPKLQHLGILANLVNPRSASHAQTLADLRATLGGLVLSQVLNDRVSITDALAAGVPVWKKKGGGESTRKASTEVQAACAEILARMK